METQEQENRYEQLYSDLLSQALQLHDNNKKRIRRGALVLVLLPFILNGIRILTDSDKIVFLIVWIICMFILSAYLISIEYLDESIRKTLTELTDREAEFDDLLSRSDTLSERISNRIKVIRHSGTELFHEKKDEDLIETIPEESQNDMDHDAAEEESGCEL